MVDPAPLPTAAHRWDFSSEVTPARARRLLAVPSFEAVVDQVMRGTIERLRFETREVGSTACTRLFYRLLISPETFDAFFNAPEGYRGQYARSPEHGDLCNARLLRLLEPMCLRALDPAKHDIFVARASLRGAAAFIWPADDDVVGIELEPQIRYQPWLRRASTDRENRHAVLNRALASRGVLAPEGSRLQITGAWIFPGGMEWRDPRDVNRGREIAECGYIRALGT